MSRTPSPATNNLVTARATLQEFRRCLQDDYLDTHERETIEWHLEELVCGAWRIVVNNRAAIQSLNIGAENSPDRFLQDLMAQAQDEIDRIEAERTERAKRQQRERSLGSGNTFTPTRKAA